MVTAAVTPSNAGSEDVATPDQRPSWLQAIPCLNPSLNFFASVGHPNKLQRTWLNCIQAMLPNAPRMKPSTTLSTPNPEESCAKSSLLVCAWHAPSAGRAPREKIAVDIW